MSEFSISDYSIVKDGWAGVCLTPDFLVRGMSLRFVIILGTK